MATTILARAGAIPVIAIAAALLPTPSTALEIYKWVDDDGVVHYSESRPEEPLATPVETLHITSANSPAYDPDEYHWSILNQADRIGDRWSAMQDEKAAQEALDRAAAAEARIDQLEHQLAAARETPDYLGARPFYGPFALFPNNRHPNRDHSRPDHDPHRPPHHDRDHGTPPEPGPRPGWTPPEAPATPPGPGFSR
jgi:hypothetical protein